MTDHDNDHLDPMSRRDRLLAFACLLFPLAFALLVVGVVRLAQCLTIGCQ